MTVLQRFIILLAVYSCWFGLEACDLPVFFWCMIRIPAGDSNKLKFFVYTHLFVSEYCKNLFFRFSVFCLQIVAIFRELLVLYKHEEYII